MVIGLKSVATSALTSATPSARTSAVVSAAQIAATPALMAEAASAVAVARATPAKASGLASRIGPALLRSMRACVGGPAWLDPLKALWIVAGLLLLELRPLRHSLSAVPVRCELGFVLAGGLRESMLSRILAYRGVFEPGLSGFIRQQVRAGDVCVDVGANVGYFSLLLAQQVGANGQVLAVEAAPGNVRKLERNLHANGWAERVRVVHAACSDFSGPCTFYVHARNDMHCRLSPPSPRELDAWLMGRQHWRPVQVQAQTLAQTLGALAPQVSFIKLDIEGAEHLISPELVACCTHERLCVALEAKAPHVRATLEPFERAGFLIYNLHNDYRWLLNRRAPRRPSPMSFAQAYATRYMVDVLLSRQPLG